MKTITVSRTAALLISGLIFCATSAQADDAFESALLSIQHEWAQANYAVTAKRERKSAFESLIDHVAQFRAAYADRAEAQAWEGIVLSTYAGEVGAMSAMKYAKAALGALERAASIDGDVLAGGIYASLGALYSKVPGGFMGFGDDEIAEQYFVKALSVDPGNIDSNYFYGEFLLDQDRYADAVAALRKAMAAPTDPSRPVFDAGRRKEIEALLAEAERKVS